jgi:hypothetical protein
MFKFQPKKSSAEEAKDATIKRSWQTESLKPEAIEASGGTTKVIVPELPGYMHYLLSKRIKGSNSLDLTGEMIADALHQYGKYVYGTNLKVTDDIMYRLGEGMPNLELILSDIKSLSPSEFNAKWALPLACSVMALSAVLTRVIGDDADCTALRELWKQVTSKEANE